MLLLRNVNLPDGRCGLDLLVQQGKIAAIGPQLLAPAGAECLDAQGQLLSPPFVDAHFHLDSALTHGQPRVNQSGTLLEGIALWGELKPSLTHEAVVERALRYCDLAVAQGVLAIRSHVDVCDPRLLAVRALLEVRERVRPYLDLQLVAFPQDGLLRQPATLALLKQALDLGVDLIGGIPHHERCDAEGRQSIRILCELAAERSLGLDLHCDETDDPNSRHVETLAAETLRLGLQGRVTASHLCSLHSMDNAYAARLIGLMAEAQLSVVANPLINILLQGRYDSYPKRRGMTRVPELLAAGVPVALGQDCVLDPWYPLGSADLLEVAHMGLHVAQLSSQAGMRACFEAVTRTPAQLLGRPVQTWQPGAPADFVLLQARDPVEALRTRAPRLLVVRGGQVLSRCEPLRPQLNLPGRPTALQPAP